MTLLASKAGGKMAQKVAETAGDLAYDKAQNIKAWGKSLGGAFSIFVMLFTNFLIDAPFINKINKKVTDFIDNFEKNKETQQKEAK